MIFACRGSAGMRSSRVPGRDRGRYPEGDRHRRLGVIVAVDTVEKAEAAVRWSKYPPFGAEPGGGSIAALGQRLPADRPTTHDGRDHDRDPRGRPMRRIAAVPGST